MSQYQKTYLGPYQLLDTTVFGVPLRVSWRLETTWPKTVHLLGFGVRLGADWLELTYGRPKTTRVAP